MNVYSALTNEPNLAECEGRTSFTDIFFLLLGVISACDVPLRFTFLGFFFPVMSSLIFVVKDRHPAENDFL